ncbi:MAG: GNAT family N-acetyltransferase [Lachnospiraceae bacterium]|nr:GNAT family N-acetyltransferase [Lachnospiraceae bacterium]
MEFSEAEIMNVIKCALKDVGTLAILNKQLIEDEKSDNPMNVKELEERMKSFLTTDYQAYFFEVDDSIVGYALVKTTCTPLYLRQFLIDRKYRKKHYGTNAFHSLMRYLGVEDIDIEVLPWNEAGKCFWESCGFREISRYMRYSG